MMNGRGVSIKVSLLSGEMVQLGVNETTTVQTLLDALFETSFKKETDLE